MVKFCIKISFEKDILMRWTLFSYLKTCTWSECLLTTLTFVMTVNMFSCFNQFVKCAENFISSVCPCSELFESKWFRGTECTCLSSFLRSGSQAVRQLLRFQRTQCDNSSWSGREPLSQCLVGLAWQDVRADQTNGERAT